ncbi:hypothetical protein TCSYLVIO_007074 [Trypanosoma cruzi]|nr:hypothetical protein TCSYLVIO_007074 [Trypanosoma cruzi]
MIGLSFLLSRDLFLFPLLLLTIHKYMHTTPSPLAGFMREGIQIHTYMYMCVYMPSLFVPMGGTDTNIHWKESVETNELMMHTNTLPSPLTLTKVSKTHNFFFFSSFSYIYIFVFPLRGRAQLVSASCFCSSAMSGVMDGTGVQRNRTRSSISTRPSSSVLTSANSCFTSCSGIFSPSDVKSVISSESFRRPESVASKARSAVRRSSSDGPVYGFCIRSTKLWYGTGSGTPCSSSLNSASVYLLPRLRMICLASV